MTFEAKTLVPLQGHPDAAHGAFEDAADGGLTLLEAPPGYILTEGLATAFTHSDRHPVWLRLGPEDRDPAAFLLSLVAAARRFQDNAGQATLELMRAQPGPVFGWSPLFTQLARDLRLCLGTRGALVLEDIHYASAASPTLALAGRYLLPGLTGAGPCVLVSHPGPAGAPLDTCTRRSASELRLSALTVGRLLDTWAPELGTRARDRAIWLIGGRAAILAGLRELAAADQGLAPLLERVGSGDELIARTAEILLAEADREAQDALGLAAYLEYAHPALTSAIAGASQLPRGPWLQDLEDGWARVRPCWMAPLRKVLGARTRPGHDTLHQSAEWLAQAGADEQAVVLYLDIGDHDCAARVITSRASALMDLGQWATVDRWLARLPEDVFAAYPDLSCSRADIAAARGDTASARQWFDIAASQYARRNDVEGECRSLLAGSALAGEAGDLANALSRAHAASSLASTDDLTAIQMWAAWQLGRVCMAAGDSDGALASFRHAASSGAAAGDVVAARPVRVAGELATKVGALRRRQEAHRAAQATLSRAEHEALNQLMAAIRAPALRNEGVFGAEGWSRAPAPLRLPQLIQQGAAPRIRAGPLNRLRRTLWPHRRDDPSAEDPAPGLAPAAAVPTAAVPAGPPVMPEVTARIGGPAVPQAARPAPQLAVHLLGPLYAAIDDVAVEEWPSARCRSLFGYLLTHREPWPPREVLMEVFWPGSPSEASRNSLNVAIHGLRRTLRTITDVPVVVHVAGSYRINQELGLWLDVDAFDSRVKSGRRFEDVGQADQATRDYEYVEGLYRGDFMMDDPYEDWAALTRERLRLAYLDTLGRLSRLYFDAGHYTACASLCQRIIEKDPCREDAHRSLMRCYSRQNQPHLALIQYRLCVRALTDELGVGADPATARLHDQIRQHQYV
jgi:DNA-binding SARP family transcriptional activator/tetratricopeptide (TPR) repeat protein